jgi:outer membrane lipoprotein carrier protein
LEWLVLTPKQASDDGFQTATLGFGPDGLARMQVTDTLGQRTEIAFSEWKKNPAFTRETFTYTPAKGVDVVGEG